jgi:Rieske Fe-S protein
MLADEVAGRSSQHADLFDPTRFDPVKAGAKFTRENANTVAEYAKDYSRFIHPRDVKHLQPGEAELVRSGEGRCAAYRAPNGEIIAVSAICTHLKCIVHWNAAEKSWDCPCHGSRFAPDGSVLEGPALRPLERIEIRADPGATQPDP